MTIKQALRLAMAAITVHIQRLAVDASLYRYFNAQSCRKNYELHEQLIEARKMLQDLEKQS